MFNFFRKDPKKTINANEIDPLIGKIELIDIREPYEYKGGSIKTAKNIPMGELLSNTEKYFKKDKAYYIMCQSGGRSSSTCNKLKEQGYDVINVKGGMRSYSGKNRK